MGDDKSASELRTTGEQVAERPTPSKVFVCYPKSRQPEAERVYDHLSSLGLDVWLDKKRLVLGDDWEAEIRRAVAQTDFFVVLFCREFDSAGFRHREVRWAIDALNHRPPFSTFIIPFILEPCDIPEWAAAFHAGDYAEKPSTVEQLTEAFEKHLGRSFRSTPSGRKTRRHQARPANKPTYVTVVDEFGHDGAYAPHDPRFSQSPVFGFGGVLIPINHCISVLENFKKLITDFQFETKIKGTRIFRAQLFSQDAGRVRNVVRFASRLLNLLESHQSWLVYVGVVKYETPDKHDARALHLSCTRKLVETLNKFLHESDAMSVLITDQHTLQEERARVIKNLYKADYTRIIDTSFVATSTHSELTQLADVSCALFHHVIRYRIDPMSFDFLKGYDERFGNYFDDLAIGDSIIKSGGASAAKAFGC